MFGRVFLIVSLAFALPLAAQEPRKVDTQVRVPAEVPVYKLDYKIVELDAGKRVDARDYTLLASADRRTSVRVGNRVPIVTAPRPDAPPAIQYMDIGVRIDSNAREASDSSILLQTQMEVSSVVLPATDAERAKVAGQPVVRNFNVSSDVVVPFGKPVVLFTSDEPSSKRSYEIHVQATKVR